MENSVKRLSEVGFHLERFIKQGRIKVSFSWPSRVQETRGIDEVLVKKESKGKLLNSYVPEVSAFIAEVKLKIFPEIS